ncbi:MAG TPA: 4-hydroxybenzoate octaprenyltransferase [Planctomycetota bacterium]|nr:4-hydroxybenzoate octaprenyltransferase [Planctomycetota bacterium]
MALRERLRVLAELVQLEHTIFGLPFAGCALAFAARRGPVPVWRIAVAVSCFTLARAAAMAWNRYVDRDLDAANPRTAQRPVPRGAVPARVALLVALTCAAGFLATAVLLGPLPLLLAPVALVILLGYSHLKRVTWGCHFGLGVALAGAPLGAGIAARATVDAEVAWLALAVGTWVAGFDLIYACLDERFDRENGVHSVPARFGRRVALGLSAALHVVSVVALALAGLDAGGGALYGASVVAAAVLLAIEHALVRPSDLSRVGAAFFTVNGVLAVLFFVGTLLDTVAKGVGT